MTINEAIRLKELKGRELIQTNADMLIAADKLSLEALKRIEAIRKHQSYSVHPSLPGETEEGE